MSVQFAQKDPKRAIADEPTAQPLPETRPPELSDGARSAPSERSSGAARDPGRLQGLFGSYGSGQEGAAVQLKTSAIADRGFGQQTSSEGGGQSRQERIKEIDERIFGLQNMQIQTTWGCVGQVMDKIQAVDEQREEVSSFNFWTRWQLSSQRDELIEELTGGSTDHVGTLLYHQASV